MKYPLDLKAMQDIAQDIVASHSAQQKLVEDLAELLRTAMECVDEDDADENPWLYDANVLLSGVTKRRIDFENHRFNQKNGHNVGQRSPFPPVAGEFPGIPIDLKREAELNAMEAQSFGEEMSEHEIASLLHTSEPPRKKKTKQKKLSKMSMDEIEAWERAQDNSNDIYKVNARVKNLARATVKGNLTAQGDMVVNMFTHVIKAFYDFADTVSDKELKIRLTELVKRQEGVPADLIAALGAGVRLK